MMRHGRAGLKRFYLRRSAQKNEIVEVLEIMKKLKNSFNKRFT